MSGAGGTLLRRRKFFAALGASLLSQWALPRSVTASASNPLRFISVYMPHGCAYECWRPADGFDLSFPGSSLAPFDDPSQFGQSFKSQLLVVDGLDLAAGIEVGTVGHQGARVLLTGSGAQGKNASLDQFLAQECGLGQETAHTSLVLAVGNDATDVGNCISYSRLAQPMPKWIDPERVFDELFGDPLTSGSGDAQAQRARGASVLDFVRNDLQQLQARISQGERAKLEQHHTALRDVEKKLFRGKTECAGAVHPDANTFPKLRAAGGGGPYVETLTELLTDLLTRALACDVTRFATLMLADLSRTRQYAELPSDIHADVAHRYATRTLLGPGKPETWHALALQNRHSYAQIASLLCKLSDAGVLADTLVYASSDMGDPSRHSSRNVPTILAGGVGGKFRMGRYLDLRSGKGDGLVPHNRLLVSILQAFGVKQDSFGTALNPGTVRGALGGLV